MLLILLTAYACLMVTVTVALVVYEILEVSADEQAYEKIINWQNEFLAIQKTLAQNETRDTYEIKRNLLAEISFPLRTYTEKVEKRLMLEELLSELDVKTEEAGVDEIKIDENKNK